MKLYSKHGAPDNPQNYNLYKKIAVDMFSQPGMDNLAAYRNWADLRNTLLGLVSKPNTKLSKRRNKFEPACLQTNQMQERGNPGEFATMLLIAHYYAVRCICRSVKSLEKIGAKISVALLRYTDIIPADKAFFEAGFACKVISDDKLYILV